jgi:diguanylate cyclase (GGDEF)-like protein/PAS domain S-box-containing protein
VSLFLVRWRHWLLLSLGLGALGAFMAFSLVQERARLETIEQERLTSQSKVIDENLSRQLAAINLTLESLITELPYWAGQVDGQARAIRRLNSMEKSMPSVRTFLVMDAQGTATASNRAELVARNFAQREYFQVHLRSRNSRLLHVSEPFLSVLNSFVINLSRAIIGPNGEFLGVVSATVDPIDIQILLNSVRYADDMRSMLVHGDGKVFVSQPASPEVIGKDVSAPGTFFTQHMQSKQALSRFQGKSESTEDQRLTVLHTIQPAHLNMDKPLVVSISRGTDALFAPWQTSLRTQLLAYLVFTLLCAISLFLFERHRTQQRTINQRLKLATEAAGVGIWEFEPGTRKYHWDPAMFTLFGLRPESVSNLNDEWKQLLLPGEVDRIRAATRAVIKHRQPFDLTFQIHHPQGHVRFLRNRAALHVGDPGSPVRLIGTTEDVTERKMREADLRIAATAFESHESMVIMDANGVIIRINHAFSALFGYSAQEALGQTLQMVQSARHEPALYASLWATILHDRNWQGEIWNQRKNGDVLPVWLSINAVSNEDAKVTHYVATHTDITLRKAAEEEINLLAFHDPLTHLPNRRLLDDRLHQAMALARRDQHRLALIFIDLDKFKPVNDEFGHAAGDELMRAVALRLQSCVRASDTIARVGGDEFVVLLPHIEATADALSVADKVHGVLKQPFQLQSAVTATVSISSSLGIAVYPDHASDELTLMRQADAAMYQAKTAGRNQVVLFAPTE